VTHPLLELLAKGHTAQRAEHDAGDAKKLGHFRGGSVGVVDTDGKVYGKCPRLSYLRSIGYQPPITPESKYDMFSAGISNEDIVVKLLRDSGTPLTVRHGDTGLELEYKLADGTLVSSRPDLVLTSGDKTVAGIETKLVCSIWTALGVHYDLKPKSDHLIQAAHYSMQLGKPTFWLLYSNRCDWHLSTAPKFLTDKFGAGVYDVEYRADGKPLKIGPFNRVYDLTWDSKGFLCYQTDGLDEPVKTKIDTAAVQRYYESVAAIRDTGVLGPRPHNKSVDGSKGYSACDYCDLKPLCDNHETNFPVWKDMVINQIGEKK
jgi:hypothetical protein